MLAHEHKTEVSEIATHVNRAITLQFNICVRQLDKHDTYVYYINPLNSSKHEPTTHLVV